MSALVRLFEAFISSPEGTQVVTSDRRQRRRLRWIVLGGLTCCLVGFVLWGLGRHDLRSDGPLDVEDGETGESDPTLESARQHSSKTPPSPDKPIPPAAHKGIVRGTVVLPPGANARTARVELFEAERAIATVETAGPFAVEYDRGAGPHRVTVEAAGFRSRAWPLPSVDTDLGRISLVQSTGYGGRVLDPDHRPLSDIRVELRWEDGRLAGRSLPTGPDGHYRIELNGPPALATRSDGTLINYMLLPFRGNEQGGALHASPYGWQLQHDIVFVPVPRQRIRLVRGPSDEPIAGARVRVGPAFTAFGLARPAQPFARGTTDEDGDFELNMPRTARSLLMEIRVVEDEIFYVRLDPREMDVPVHVVPVTWVWSTQADVRWARNREAAVGAEVWIQGLVPDADATEEPGAPPFLVQRGTPVCAAGVVDPEGVVRFRIAVPGEPDATGIRIDRLWVTYRSQGLPQTESREPPPGLIASGEAMPPIELEGVRDESSGAMWAIVTEAELKGDVEGGRPVVPLHGRLSIFKGGKPVASSAMWFSPTPYEGADGTVLWRTGQRSTELPDDLVPSGEFERAVFTVAVAGRAPRDVIIARSKLRAAWAGEKALALRVPRMSAGVTIHVDDDSGKPAAGVLVSLLPEGDARHEDWRLTTDASGDAWCADFDADATFVVTAYDPLGGGAVRLRGWRPRETTLQLRPPRALKIRAVYRGGKAAAGAQLDLWTRPTGMTRNITVIADDKGWLEIPPCVQDLYEFSITAHDDEYAKTHNIRSVATHERRIQGGEVEDGDEIILDPR